VGISLTACLCTYMILSTTQRRSKLYVLGASLKSCRGRVQLNCGPVTSAGTLNINCSEYLVRYLLTRFVHILRGILFYRFFVSIYVVFYLFCFHQSVAVYLRTRADHYLTCR